MSEKGTYTSDAYDDDKKDNDVLIESKSVSDDSSFRYTLDDQFSHLPKSYADTLRKQVSVEETKTSFFSLYRYAKPIDVLLLLVGLTFAIAEGCIRPLQTVVFGSLTETFTLYTQQTNRDFNNLGGSFVNGTFYNATEYLEYFEPEMGFTFISPDEFQRRVNSLAVYFLYLAAADFFFSYAGVYLFIDRGEVISGRIKELYLRSTLHQNIGYFDKLGAGEMTTRMSSDIILIQEGMSEKVFYIASSITVFVAAFVVGFSRAYKLTFIMMSIAAGIIGAFTLVSPRMVKYFRNALEGASTGNSLAEEVFSSVRNVQAFGIQERLASMYDKYLEVSEFWGFRAGVALGSVTGIMWLGVYSNNALGFWQGARFIRDNEATVGQVVTTLMSMVLTTFSITNISPHARNITNGMAAAAKIYSAIDRKTPIDAGSESGEKLSMIQGDIELKDITFIYPSRPDVYVLRNFNLKIPAGKTVALVGASGSGKSTIVGILERFYEPVSGEVTIDGANIKDLNVRWLRQQIALVSQEPTLFDCSIFENISYGLIGTQYEDASLIEKRELVIRACEQANAMSFIDTFPKGLETLVGDRGFLMSGGQKQRIAIARAIVSDPRILILDEATSALDTKSEDIVQDALDKASRNRTTIVIAHRLSTIKNADSIVVMMKGKIVEQGTHDDLISRKGEYYGLVTSQRIDKQDNAQQASTGDEHTVNEKSKETGLVDYDTMQQLERTESISEEIIKQRSLRELPDLSSYSIISLIKFLYVMSKEEAGINLLGTVMSLVCGLGYVSMGLFFSRCVEAFRAIPDYDYMTSQIAIFSGLFFMVACVESIATSLSLACFSYAQQRLVRRIRLLTFRQLLRQDIAFYDRDDIHVGSLANTLAVDAQAVEGLSGSTFGQMMNSVMIVLSGTVVSLVLAWQLALVCIACMPFIIGGGFFRFWVLSQFQANTRKFNEKSSAYACEAFSAIRTVVTLTREEDVMENYKETAAQQLRESRPATNKSAFWYGVAQAIQYLIFCLVFWYGSTYIRRYEYTLLQFYTTYITAVVGAQAAGTIFSFAPDMSKARDATANIKRITEMVPEIDIWSPEGSTPESVQGEVEFCDVHFRYPTRPEVSVLRGLNLKVKRGQYVALVGSSGCGKSTTISLLEGFYRPLSGTILLDGQDISKFNINKYREELSLVQQEPTLYAGSIRENIELGTSRKVTDEEIYSVCKQANIHDFIISLPDGYDTLCGNKGTLLSGGQKQRIAIARALIRNPKVLLLDEATSALDSESEKIVQASLDDAAKGRTTIAIAHRLSSIQNADIIYVFENGRILECGNHQELLARRSKYYELVQLQALEK
ncbi:P-loop containing nucleoside triphosphate hydrolase protein [Dipodascopsis uninucleata]